ncbi:MAG: hypothetical protein E6K24_13325 [Gammaproteobacteria bacterium]|nr:MAG: hypothetical protein E6K24_13325 [Gammaproteobacteria bacterium]
MSLVRNVFLTLLFVNLAYFAWSHWIDEPPPPPVNESIARLPRLKLASEDPPPPPSGHAAETGLTVSPALSVSPPPGCLSVGPFGDVDAAARAAALLRGKGFDPRQRRQAGDGSPERRLPGTLYWLDLVPPAGMSTVPIADLFAGGVGSRIAVQPCPSASPHGALPGVEVVTRVQDRAMAASPAPQIAATRAVP